MLTQPHKIDMVPGGVPLTINVTQFDVDATVFEFTPFTSIGEFDFSTVKQAQIQATKPDGYAVIHNCTVGSGVITYVLQEQLAAVAGRVWSKLVLMDEDGGVVGSKAIVWIVDRAGVTDDSVVSDSDIPAIDEAIKMGMAAVNAADAAETAAERAKASENAATVSADTAGAAQEAAESARDLAQGYADKAGTIVNYGNLTAIFNAAGHLEINATIES